MCAFRKSVIFFCYVFFFHFCILSYGQSSKNDTLTHAVILQSIVPMYSNPDDSNELYDELLFGETCSILEKEANWYYVMSDATGTKGWINIQENNFISSPDYASCLECIQSKDYAMVKPPMAYATNLKTKQRIPLTAGTKLLHYEHGEFEVLGNRFFIDSSMVLPYPLEMNRENLLSVVEPLLNVPYVWGGRNIFGMDCSGLTQIVYSYFGCKLPRNSRSQSKLGEDIPSLEESKAGDLVFFDHYDNRISHVGILLDGYNVVHCGGPTRSEGCVNITKIDSTGIYKGEKCVYHLVAIRRYNFE